MVSNKGLILVWTIDKSTNGGTLERKDVAKRKLSSTFKETGWAAIDSNGEYIVVSGWEDKNKMCYINLLDGKLNILRCMGDPCDIWCKFFVIQLVLLSGGHLQRLGSIAIYWSGWAPVGEYTSSVYTNLRVFNS